MVIAITAADDCTMQVMTVPMARKIRMVRWLFVSNELKKLMTEELCSKSSSLPAELSSTSEKNRKAIPKRKSPMYLLRLE